MQQLMTESEWMTQTFEQNRQEMVLLENEWSWSPERPPQLFMTTKPFKSGANKLRIRKLFKRTRTKAFLASQIENLEDQLTDFEKRMPHFW